MENLRKLLPSAGSLIVFECAGRHMSFTAAARELGMTQAAVSYAVGRLEKHLSTPLFHREHRRVRLTEAGTRFLGDVALGLSYIHKSAEALRADASGSHVTLSASTAFASMWMVPRLQAFREDLPDIDLRIQTSDRDLDLVAENIPLGIRGGVAGDWPEYRLLPLASEQVYPVCSVGYCEKFGLPESVESLLSHTLIHLEEPHRPAATWGEWFQSAGVESRRTPKGLRMNDYVLVIQSVLEGQGVALGWHHLVDGMVKRGVLVRLTSHSMMTGKSFNVAWPREVGLSSAAQRVCDWLSTKKIPVAP